jgi:serine/threonine-protein phosphatase 4 catalytic subunit
MCVCVCVSDCYRCGNVAAIMQVSASGEAKFEIFEAAPSEARAIPAKKPPPDYFL